MLACTSIDEEEILEIIEKLKGLPYGIFEAMEGLIHEELLDLIDEELGEDIDLLTEYYFESHPDYPDDEDIEEADDYDDFYDNLTKEQKEALIWKSYDNASGDEQDKLSSEATERAAEYYDLPVFIACVFCMNAYPYHLYHLNLPDDDIEDKSTPEEIEAEWFAGVKEFPSLLKYVPEALKAQVEKALKGSSGDDS